MNFLRPLGFGPSPIRFRGKGVELRTPVMDDYPQWSRLREQSRPFLVPWEPLWHEDELSRAAFRLRVRHARKAAADGTGYSLLVFDEAGHILLGGLTLSNIRRGVAQCATLGYWVGLAHARQGHMTRAVEAAKRLAFSELGLHRIEAACLPSNTASIRLLQRTGFEREGFAKAYLQIAGRWEDHILWAMRNSAE